MNNKKFRVWDRLEQRFIYPDRGYQGHYTLSLDGKFQNLQNGSGGNEYDVQQFLGILDKNMKEIYEGDFVECFYAKFLTGLRETRVLGEVKYNRDKGSYIIGDVSMYNINIDSLEIVGNIFEGYIWNEDGKQVRNNHEQQKI